MFYEETLIRGLLYYRTTPTGVYQLKPPGIDAMLAVLKVMYDVRSNEKIMEKLGLDIRVLNRARANGYLNPRDVLVIHDITGMSIEQIRKVSGTPTIMEIEELKAKAQQ